MTRRTVDVLSPLLTAPTVQGETARHLLAAVDLVPRTTIPKWIEDPDLIASILLGLVDLPDDLRGAR